MGKDYTLSLPSHFQYPKLKTAAADKHGTAAGPGENIIQFILSYNAALFTHECSDGMSLQLLMN